MVSSNLKTAKNFKFKVRKKSGRLGKIIADYTKDLGISRTRVKTISNGLIFSAISKRPINLDHKLSDDETLILELDLDKKKV